MASARAILFGSGPRFARDAFGPVLAFYVGWKLVGLVLGIALASTVSLLAYRYERRRERPGMIARLALVFIVVQASIGLASNSAKVYLAQPVVLNGLLGLPNKSPNNILGDGVDANDKTFLAQFPYVASPHQGYEVP